MTATQDEKTKRTAQNPARKELGECHSVDGRGGLETFGGESQVVGNEQNQADYSTSSNSFGGSRTFSAKADFGKISSQLRSIRAAHLAILKDSEDRLRIQLDENLACQQQITSEIDKLEMELAEFLNYEHSNGVITDQAN